MRTFPLRTAIITTTCTLIALAVTLSGMHAKDLASYSVPAFWLDAKKQVDDVRSQIIKITGELHDHSVKTAKVLDIGDQTAQADHRSLRLMHDHKKVTPLSNHIGFRLRMWWQLHAVHLS